MIQAWKRKFHHENVFSFSCQTIVLLKVFAAFLNVFYSLAIAVIAPFLLACVFFITNITHKVNESWSLWRATCRVQWPSRKAVLCSDKSGCEAFLTTFPGNINFSKGEVSVFDGVFMVTTNIWFWCLGVVFKKDDFWERNAKPLYCHWHLKCGVPMQRYNYLFVHHNVTTLMNDYGCFSHSKLSPYHKGWKKTECSMRQ